VKLDGVSNNTTNVPNQSNVPNSTANVNDVKLDTASNNNPKGQ
jgi:hypothetical protein